MTKKTKCFDFDSELIVNATSSASFYDRNGVMYEVCAGQANRFVSIVQEAKLLGENEWRVSASVKNISKHPLFLKELAVIDVSGRNGGSLGLDGVPTLWTISGPMSMTVDDSAGVCDLGVQRCEMRKHDFYSADYLVIGNRYSGKYITCGYLTFEMAHGVLRLKFEQDVYNLEYFRAICEFDGYRLEPGETVHSEQFYINLGEHPPQALRKYGDKVLADVKRRPPLKPISGWGTWDYYLNKITEDDVLENVRWLARHRKELPVEYIQIDHGYDRCEGDWLETNEKFPHGLHWLANEIKHMGFKPAIWLCPYLVSSESKVYREHPDWVIKDKTGQPVRAAGYTKKQVFILDCSLDVVRKWVRKLGASIRSLGYQYVKLDGANVQPMAQTGVLSDLKFTKGQAMRLGLEAFRQGIGEDVVLLNACLFGISVGLVDAMRIGGDAGARWDAQKIDKHHGERDNYPGPGYIYRAVKSAMNFDFMHNRWWINDPDYLVVRPKGDRSELSLEEARSWASAVGLSNGLIMLSDRMKTLPAERLEILTKVLPHYREGARTVDFFKEENPHILDLKVSNKTEEWHVTGIFNTNRPDRPRKYTLDFKGIGLDSGREYLVFDFWARKFLGKLKGSFKTGVLPPHHCQVLCIRENRNVPQVLSTDMHITQGGVEVLSSIYDAAKSILRIELAPVSKTGRIYVHMPRGFRAVDSSMRQNGSVLEVPVKINGRNREIAVRIKRG